MPLSRARMRERKRSDRLNVKPKCALPEWIVKPNQYLQGHLRVCSDYDPLNPGEHWKTCPYVNPALRSASAIPK